MLLDASYNPVRPDEGNGLEGCREMSDLAVVFDRQQVMPGETVKGTVFVNYEGKARSLTITLVNREQHGSLYSFDRVITSEDIATPHGLRAGQRFPFSFALPLEATPMFRSMPTGRFVIDRSTRDRFWGVSAEIDRRGLDHKAFSGLDVVRLPPEHPAMALVMPHEVEQMQCNTDRGINTMQRSQNGFIRPKLVTPADGIGIRCDPPVARRGQALMVDVNVPAELGPDFAIGLFLYESYWASSGRNRPATERFRTVWSEAQPIPALGVSRMVLRVPSDQPPTHHGWQLATWWDVRPCFGSGPEEPSQRISQPVIIRV